MASGLIITVALFAGVRHWEHSQAEREFRIPSNVRIAAIREEMLRAVDALETINKFFRTLGAVDRQQFHTFATAMLGASPNLRSLSFQRVLKQAERPAYEAGVRKYYPNFSIGQWVDGKRVPIGPMSSYRVVDYLEPMQGNEAAFGLDVSSNLKQADAMQRARDTGLPSASELLRLPQEPKSQRSFVVLMPVYRHGAALRDTESRRSAVIGYTTATIRTGTLVENALRDKNLFADPGLSLGLYAANRADERVLAFRIGRDQTLESKNTLWLSWLFYDRPRSVSHTFNVAGKSWHVTVSAQPVWFALRHDGSPIMLLAGLIATAVGTAYVQARGLRSSRSVALASRRCASLQAANVMVSKDIALRQQEEQARELRERANDASDHAVIITSAQGPDYPIEHVDDAFERITGYSTDEAVGRNCSFLWGDDDDQHGIDKLRAAANQMRVARMTLRIYRKDGTVFVCGAHVFPVKEASGEAACFVMALYDLTAITCYRRELEFQANHDAVTKLANQALLHDRLAQAIAYANRYADPLWVIAIDIYGFGSLNETFGAEAGAILWAKVGERLQSIVRVTDTVARLGGGEFVLLLAARRDESLSPHVVRHLLHTIRQPLTVADHEFLPDCGVGVAIYPNDGEDSETLITNACGAMRRAGKGGNKVAFCSPPQEIAEQGPASYAI